MKKLLLLSVFTSLLFFNHVNAQKNPVLVKQSFLTGIELPQRSMRINADSMVSSARNFLQQEAKLYGSNVNNVEVLKASASGDSIISGLRRGGWVVTPDERDKRFFWITKGSRSMLAYSGSGNLYFGEIDKLPKLRR